MRNPALHAAGAVAALLAATSFLPRAAVAQQSAVVELLAPILAAEDARILRPDLLRPAIQSTEPVARRIAAISVGRVGDPRGVGLLPPLLVDPDSVVRASAVFSVGLIGDTSAVEQLLQGFRVAPIYDDWSAEEAVTALARIGGRTAASFLTRLLERTAVTELRRPDLARSQAALNAWRLGADAPVDVLASIVNDSASSVRYGAIYSLVRLQAASAAPQLAQALRDENSLVRATAVRGFTPGLAGASEFGIDGAVSLILPLLDDPDAGVRVHALRTLGGLRVARSVDRVMLLLDDPVPGVRIEAARALSAIGDPAAGPRLEQLAGRAGLPALEAEALRALARADTARLTAAVTGWLGDPDWYRRAAAAEALAYRGGDNPLLDDSDVRVRAAAFAAWVAIDSGPVLAAAARTMLQEADVGLRTLAANVLARNPAASDVALLADAYRRASGDRTAEAAIAALYALRGIAQTPAGQAMVARDFLGSVPRPESAVLRRWAEDAWPALALRWGAPRPVSTGRSLQDYRDIVRRFVVAPDSIARPHIIIETEQRGSIEVELLGPSAPMTVAHFLALVDRHYFDGNRWHRLVPNFVIQSGDPRGDGWGGGPTTVRDEVSLEQFNRPMMGLASSGPDSGSTQWFINLSPQPHLDGVYTLFGRVVGSYQALGRIMQGDVIRTVRR